MRFLGQAEGAEGLSYGPDYHGDPELTHALHGGHCLVGYLRPAWLELLGHLLQSC